VSRLFPAVIDNRFPGHILGLWLFVPVVLMRFGLALAHIFRRDGGARISAIPLETYPPGAAQNLVGMFARIGIEQLTLALLFLLVLTRYRAMVPLMFLIVILNYMGARLIGERKPLSRTGASGAAKPALVIVGICVVGLAVSLFTRSG
jgi:hypothetical protein